MREIPRIISVDDHVVEPRHLWETYLPAKLRERGPKVVRDNASVQWINGNQVFTKGGDGPETDWWVYEDLAWSHQMLNACAGYDESEWWMGPIAFDQMRPGCYDPKARLADMDLNHVEASLCFPTYPRFCGQLFAERDDKVIALACVRAYNDWMVDEWSGDSSGRLLPLCLVPLWDPQLAADEVRRNAARGCARSPSPSFPGSSDFRRSTTATATGSRSSPRAPRPQRASSCTSDRARPGSRRRRTPHPQSPPPSCS